MNYVEKLIVGKLAERLIAHAAEKQLLIVVDGDRGYDPEAFSAQPTHDMSNDQLRDMVDRIVNECNEYDEVHIFLDKEGEDGTFDDDGRPVEGHGDWVYLIFGNGNGGWDVITDYITRLEDVIQPVLDFVMQEGD